MVVMLQSGISESERQRVKDAVRNVQFFIRDEANNKLFGKVVAFMSYMDAYGAVVTYPTGEAGFWGYDNWTDQVIYLGEAPALPRMGVEDRGHELNRIDVKAIAGSGTRVLEASRATALSVVQPVGEIDRQLASIAALYPPAPPETICETPPVQSTIASKEVTLVSKARRLWRQG
jgi:hypothetical protein